MSVQSTPMLDQIRSFPSSAHTSPQKQMSSQSSQQVEPSGRTQCTEHGRKDQDTEILHSLEKEFLLEENKPNRTQTKRIDIMKDGTLRVVTTIVETYQGDALFSLFDSSQQQHTSNQLSTSRPENRLASTISSSTGPSGHRKRSSNFTDFQSIFNYGSPQD